MSRTTDARCVAVGKGGCPLKYLPQRYHSSHGCSGTAAAQQQQAVAAGCCSCWAEQARHPDPPLTLVISYVSCMFLVVYADGNVYKVQESNLVGHTLFQPAVRGHFKFRAFLNDSNLQADCKDALLQACRDRQPVDSKVGDLAAAGWSCSSTAQHTHAAPQKRGSASDDRGCSVPLHSLADATTQPSCNPSSCLQVFGELPPLLALAPAPAAKKRPHKLLGEPSPPNTAVPQVCVYVCVCVVCGFGCLCLFLCLGGAGSTCTVGRLIDESQGVKGRG